MNNGSFFLRGYIDWDLFDLKERYGDVVGNYVGSTVAKKIVTFPLFLICTALYLVASMIFVLYIVLRGVYELIVYHETWVELFFIIGLFFIWAWLFIVCVSAIIGAITFLANIISKAFYSNYVRTYEITHFNAGKMNYFEKND